LVLRRAWDQFALAWPFSRVEVVLGDPVDPATTVDPRAEIERALAVLNAELAR
jgi:lysophospholipid acyltransferase (LPLAT)-like uncharacterized protein